MMKYNRTRQMARSGRIHNQAAMRTGFWSSNSSSRQPPDGFLDRGREPAGSHVVMGLAVCCDVLVLRNGYIRSKELRAADYPPTPFTTTETVATTLFSTYPLLVAE